MYRRSYEYTVTQKQKEEFINKVKDALNYLYTYTIDNDYAYDMCRDKKIKTIHRTMFFYKFDKHVLKQISNYSEHGYSVQINSTENQSIPEINHLHFIKIIDD